MFACGLQAIYESARGISHINAYYCHKYMPSDNWIPVWQAVHDEKEDGTEYDTQDLYCPAG
jgi:hypothetical protein